MKTMPSLRHGAALCLALPGLLLILGCTGGRPIDAPARSEPRNDEGSPSAEPAADLPLLGSRRGGHAWFDFCAGEPDDTLLPPDPRSLVQPGIDAGRAVLFNAYWQDCHIDPYLVGGQAHPHTCGELRASSDRGGIIMTAQGTVGQGTASNLDRSESSSAVSAENYNTIWRGWGMSARPDNFDELFSERIGSPLSPTNPYPLPGEDPNTSNGGSGRLPLALTQLREPDGRWTGMIATTCYTCHGSKVGEPEDGPGLGIIPGLGNETQDLAVLARDMFLAGSPAALAGVIVTSQRGSNNASAFQLVALGGIASGQEAAAVLTSGSTAIEVTPPWWNVGSRTFKFWDGLYPADGTRVDMAFFRGGEGAEEWAKLHNQDADKWIMNRKAPAYPLPVNENLAKAGAVLFHAKDLWARGLNNPRPRPEGGNGSCASCHGAYSPRFVHDPSFLADPALEGIAGYLTPREIIGTDPVRLDSMDEDTTRAYSRTFSTYPETRGTPQDCGPRTLPELSQGRRSGYLAPPLYGVWATAPYLHNGSVPDMWSLLKPADRPAIWRRVSTPARPDQEGQVVMGFDTNLQRAYDQERMGWRFDEIQCGDELGAVPLLDCGIPSVYEESFFRQAAEVLYGNVLAAWNVGNLPQAVEWTKPQIEARKIYNTGNFSQSNAGHDFTEVLTDAERRALIEYLKTL